MTKRDLSQYLHTGSGSMINTLINAARSLQWALHGGIHPVVPPLPGRDLVPGTYIPRPIASAKVLLVLGALMAGGSAVMNLIQGGFQVSILFGPIIIMAVFGLLSRRARGKDRDKYAREAHTLRFGHLVEGQIQSLEHLTKTRDGSTHKDTQLEIVFEDHNQAPITFTRKVGAHVPPEVLKVGDPISILYPPEDPEQAVVPMLLGVRFVETEDHRPSEPFARLTSAAIDQSLNQTRTWPVFAGLDALESSPIGELTYEDQVFTLVPSDEREPLTLSLSQDVVGHLSATLLSKNNAWVSLALRDASHVTLRLGATLPQQIVQRAVAIKLEHTHALRRDDMLALWRVLTAAVQVHGVHLDVGAIDASEQLMGRAEPSVPL